MSKLLLAGIGAFVILGVLYAYHTGKEEVMMEQKAMEEKHMMQKDGEEMMDVDAAMMDKGDDATMMKKDTPAVASDDAMMKTGSYEAYSPEKIARAEAGDVVLFFHASWCPSCRGLNASLEAGIKSIPEGVTILKVDYDKEVELKKKYGVTYQHTLVQVDANGNQIKKWSGSGSLEKLLAQVQ
jgi:thioredoxin 1